jgi:hypothetical protein
MRITRADGTVECYEVASDTAWWRRKLVSLRIHLANLRTRWRARKER